MSIPDTEPDIRVGLITCGAPLLAPRGEYEISRDAGGAVCYRALNQRSFMPVSYTHLTLPTIGG